MSLSYITLQNNQIYNKNKIISKIKLLGKGHFGEVYKYDDDIVVKFVKDPREVLILQFFDSKHISCDIVGAKLLGISDGYFVIAMPEMSGDLSNFIVETSKEMESIMIIISKIILCIENNNLIYTDLKLDNILYKKVDSEMQLVIGDLGGFYDINSNLDPISINPIPYLMYSPEKKKRVDKNRKGLFFDKSDYSVLGLCRVFIQLFGKEFEVIDGNYTFDLSNVPQNIQNFLMKYINKIKFSYEKIDLNDFISDLIVMKQKDPDVPIIHDHTKHYVVSSY